MITQIETPAGPGEIAVLIMVLYDVIAIPVKCWEGVLHLYPNLEGSAAHL